MFHTLFYPSKLPNAKSVITQAQPKLPNRCKNLRLREEPLNQRLQLNLFEMLFIWFEKTVVSVLPAVYHIDFVGFNIPEHEKLMVKQHHLQNGLFNVHRLY